MNEKIKPKLLITLFSLLIICGKITISNAQNSDSSIVEQIAANCKAHRGTNKVKSFADCKKYSDEKNNQICCYLTGLNSDNTHSDECISVNSNLFANKSISFSSQSIYGTLICTDDYTYNTYINISFLSLLIIILLYI